MKTEKRRKDKKTKKKKKKKEREKKRLSGEARSQTASAFITGM